MTNEVRLLTGRFTEILNISNGAVFTLFKSMVFDLILSVSGHVLSSSSSPSQEGTLLSVSSGFVVSAHDR